MSLILRVVWAGLSWRFFFSGMVWDRSRGCSDLVAHWGCVVRGGHRHLPGGWCSLLGSALLHMASSSVSRLGLPVAIQEREWGLQGHSEPRSEVAHHFCHTVWAEALCRFAKSHGREAGAWAHVFQHLSEPCHPLDNLPPKSAVFTLNSFLRLLS